MAAAWRCEVNATDKIVLLALADHANDDGYCWPGNTSLQQKCGLSERAVRTAMQSLETAGHMTRHYNTGKSTTYHIHPGTKCPRQYMPPAPRAATPAPRAPKSSGTIIAKKATPSQQRDAKPKPILPDGVSPELWDDFKSMRKAKRAAMTPKAESLLIAKLGRLHAARCWQGTAVCIADKMAAGWRLQQASLRQLLARQSYASKMCSRQSESYHGHP